MKQRIDTEDNWKAKNPVLLNGELGLISGDPRYKIGNGTSPWEALPFRGVGIEEYDNRTLVQADGLVDTDDVHYFLPNANPTDKKHTFAMLSDIPEGGEGGGSAGGSGALKVWMPIEDVSTELTPEQIAENVATYNEIVKGEPVSVVLCQGGSFNGMTSVATMPTTARCTDVGGKKAVVLLANQFVDGEIATTLGQLYSDGSVAMTTEIFVVPSSSGVVFYTTNTGEVSEEQKAKNVAAFSNYAAGIPVSVIVNAAGREATYYPFVASYQENDGGASGLSFIVCNFPMNTSNGGYAAMLFYEDGSVVMQME